MPYPLSFHITFESAIHFLTTHLPKSKPDSRKPILFHNIRVGMYLYNNNYSKDIIIAGLLHDTLEWSSTTEEMIKKQFGDRILELVKANTKNRSIEDKHERTHDLISRAIACGEDALIIKSADILDSFKWYAEQNNEKELEYCKINADKILELKHKGFKDEIFGELKKYL